VTTVVRAAPQFEIRAKKDVYTLSSIAVSAGRLIVPTESCLYSLAHK
jgi:hypothetical protein